MTTLLYADLSNLLLFVATVHNATLLTPVMLSSWSKFLFNNLSICAHVVSYQMSSDGKLLFPRMLFVKLYFDCCFCKNCFGKTVFSDIVFHHVEAKTTKNSINNIAIITGPSCHLTPTHQHLYQ